MEHRIVRRIIGCKDFIAIDKAEFEATLLAQESFFIALGTEEKFDLLSENYLEFEDDLLQLSMRRMLFQEWTWSQLKGDISRINRRLMNLLATGRTYRDQIDRDLCALYGHGSDKRQQIQTALSHEYDTRFGYRMMEELRNHSQHFGMLLWGIGYETSVDASNVEPHRVKWICVPKASVSELRADRKFKKSILDDASAEGDKFDVRPLVRQYMSGIASVHLRVRQLLVDDVKHWRQQLVGMRDRFRTEFGEDLSGLAVAEIDEVGRWVRHANIFDDFMDEYDRLLRKHCKPQKYESQFVSSDA